MEGESKEKRIIVLGGIGANERKNRDGFRVFDRGGHSVSLQAHIHTEPPLVVKRWKLTDKDA